jgi:hypothetical protein
LNIHLAAPEGPFIPEFDIFMDPDSWRIQNSGRAAAFQVYRFMS